MDERFDAFMRDMKARSSPIRPRPTNPHDARLEGVEANVRRVEGGNERAAGLVCKFERRVGASSLAMTEDFMLEVKGSC